jgi:hypothetical protein
MKIWDNKLTRTAKHSNQLAGTTTVVTDGYDIIEYAVIGLSEVCEYIDKDICSLSQVVSRPDLKPESRRCEDLPVPPPKIVI